MEAAKRGRRDSVLEDEGPEDHHDTNINGCDLRSTGGWFPAVYTAEPTDEQMLFYQVCGEFNTQYPFFWNYFDHRPGDFR